MAEESRFPGLALLPLLPPATARPSTPPPARSARAPPSPDCRPARSWGAAAERAWLVAAAAIGALVEAAPDDRPAAPGAVGPAGSLGTGDLRLLAGRLGEHLALAFPLPAPDREAEAAELAALAFEEAVE